MPRPPQNGIGRSMKTGKEEIVGLLVALRRYAGHDEAAERRAGRRVTERLATELARYPGSDRAIEPAQTDGRPCPDGDRRIDEAVYGSRRRGARSRLRCGAIPIVVVGDHEAEAGS
jgi:L-seryl-tRNA(Ser) seleniumtransferase